MSTEKHQLALRVGRKLSFSYPFSLNKHFMRTYFSSFLWSRPGEVLKAMRLAVKEGINASIPRGLGVLKPRRLRVNGLPLLTDLLPEAEHYLPVALQHVRRTVWSGYAPEGKYCWEIADSIEEECAEALFG